MNKINNGTMIAQARTSSAESIDRLDATRGGGTRGRHPGPHRGYGRGYGRQGWSDAISYFQTDVYPVVAITSVEDEIAYREKIGRKFFLHRPGRKSHVSGQVIEALKDRGWTEQEGPHNGVWLVPPGKTLGVPGIPKGSNVWDVQPNKMVVRDQDHFAAWTPTSGSPYGRRPEGAYVGEIDVIPEHGRVERFTELGRIGGLGRYSMGGTYTLTVKVRDVLDRPFPGITIQAAAEDGHSAEFQTNSDGIAIVTLTTSAMRIDMVALLPEGPSKILSTDVNLIEHGMTVRRFDSIERAPQAIVNTMEAVAGGGGLALLLIGLWLDSTPVKVIGEIGMVASIFNRVGRAL